VFLKEYNNVGQEVDITSLKPVRCVLTDMLSHLAELLQHNRTARYLTQWSTVGPNVLHAEETFILSSVDKVEYNSILQHPVALCTSGFRYTFASTCG
jgi:hypothetical protein